MGQFEIRVSKRVRSIALYTLFFMVAIHGYRYVSLGFSHDSLAFMSGTDATWKISLGRFMQPVYWKLRGRVAAPYIVGMMCWVWMFLSACVVDRLLNLRTNAARFLTVGVMCGSLALISANGTYIHESDMFMLALFLNTMAAWICVNARRRYMVCAAVLLAVSAGLYQAYLRCLLCW